MGFITSPEGELIGDDVMDGERVSNFEPGVFKYLNPGESVTVPSLDSPDGQFEPFLRAMLRAMAAGIGCSYETISRDFSQTNPLDATRLGVG
jgi:capsid protein